MKKSANINTLLAWAFQMAEATPVKVQRFTAISNGGTVSDLTEAERAGMAYDVLAKVARLNDLERAAVVANFTGSKIGASYFSRVEFPLLECQFCSAFVLGRCRCAKFKKNIAMAKELKVSLTTVKKYNRVIGARFYDVLQHAMSKLEKMLADEICCLMYQNIEIVCKK